MGELIRREAARAPLAFSGERLTAAIAGQVQIEHYHRYLLARELCRGKDVLDIASGEGYGTALLAQVAKSTIGVEIDPDVVSAARQEFQKSNLSFLQGDAREIPLPDASVDVVVSFETLEHLAEQDLFLSELRRVLRQGGLLIISTPDRDTYSPIGSAPNPYHVLELTRAEFEGLLLRHFSNAAFAAQRALIGSVIFGDTQTGQLKSYETRSDSLIEGSDNLSRAPYLLGLASDSTLPALPNSVYVYRGDLDTDPLVRAEAEIARQAAEARQRGAEEQLVAAVERAEEGAERERNASHVIEGLREDVASAALRAQQATQGADASEDRAKTAMQREAEVTRQWRIADDRANTAMQQIAETTQQWRIADDRANTAMQQVAEATQHWHTADDRANTAMQQVAEATQQAEHVQHQMEEMARQLAQRLHAIEYSSVWRATRPLRTVSSRVPFVARSLRRSAKLVWWTVTLQLPARYAAWRRYRQAHLTPTSAAVAPQSGLPIATQPNVVIVEILATPLTSVSTEPALRAEDIRVPSSHDPVVSIIISTYGQVGATLACLKSIADHAPRHPIEVLVVDDAYVGPEDVSVFGDVAGIHLSRNDRNLGFLRSSNRAAQSAKGRYIHMLNNDTELLPDSIDALVDLLDARPDVGMAGSKLLFPDGRLQEAGGILWTDASGWNYGRGDDPGRSEYNYIREVDYCSGASLMISRMLFEKLGGFDEAFAPAYYEDVDLAFRARQQGLKVLFDPKSVVVHHEGMSHGTDLTTGVKAHQVTNQARILERWGAILARENYGNAEHVVRARDRARSRKLILVIDHYVPEPDRDAGSRSSMGILDSLVDAGWLVKLWPHNRAYSPVYTVALEQKGIEVLDYRWPGDLGAWLRENGDELDHLLIIRPDIATDVLPLVTGNTDAVLSFYGVDLHFARMRRQADLEGNAQLHRDAMFMERRERHIWRQFDVVIYPSEEEAAVVSAMAPRTLARGIVPFCFDTLPARVAPPHERTILFVAGFAHPPNVDAAVFLMEQVVPQLEEQIGPVNVILAGSNPTETVRALAGPKVQVTGYVTEERLGELYEQNRVAVVPLRFGAGVKGKVVEALSRGVPLVTTSIGSQGIVGLEEVVPVCDDIPAIVDALKTLLTDDAAWIAQSQAQVDFAEQFFSRSAMRRSVLEVLAAGEAAVDRSAAK